MNRTAVAVNRAGTGDERDRSAVATEAIAATLRFAKGGGRTFLAHQSVPYPFHITRPHYLDAAMPDLATLYLQSAAGGYYRGDRLALSIQAARETRAHVTSQAGTVVHSTMGGRIQVGTRLEVAPDAVLALTTDPYILFPGTDLEVTTAVTLAPGAAALVAEGFSVHDPSARAAPFGRLSVSTRIVDQDDRALVDERSCIDGAAYAAAQSPLGPFRAMGAVFILGTVAHALDPMGIESALDAVEVLAGCSRLPNQAGWAVRLLARDGGHLRRGLEVAFAIGFETLVGTRPAYRRK